MRKPYASIFENRKKVKKTKWSSISNNQWPLWGFPDVNTSLWEASRGLPLCWRSLTDILRIQLGEYILKKMEIS
jgi:hypothetical protein